MNSASRKRCCDMYIVELHNTTNGVAENVRIHDKRNQLLSGKVVKGINAIDSFTAALHPANVGYNKLHDYKTLVSVYNTRTGKYDFEGRLLRSDSEMSETGRLTKSITCESFLGFLHDSVQSYVKDAESPDDEVAVVAWLDDVLVAHNKQVEPGKVFYLGTIDDEIAAKKVPWGIQQKSTLENIKARLIDELGCEVRPRVKDGKIYLDVQKSFGELKTTTIAVSKNMRKIVRERDASDIVTRLIPLGAKKGDDTEERYDITDEDCELSPKGVNYIEDTEALEAYGIRTKIVEFNDETIPFNLYQNGKVWLEENNKVRTKYTVDALDLSILGLSIDDFDVCNTHPIKNHLLGIDDTARIIKKTIDVCDETKSTIELGEKFQKLTEIQQADAVSIGELVSTVKIIQANYVTNKQLQAVDQRVRTVESSLISQTEKEILLQVAEGYQTAAGDTVYDKTASMLMTSNGIDMKGNKISITSTNFTLTRAGVVTAKKGVFDDCEIKDTCKIYGTVLANKVCTNTFTSYNTKLEKTGTYTGSLWFANNNNFQGFELAVDIKYNNDTTGWTGIKAQSIDTQGLYLGSVHDVSDGTIESYLNIWPNQIQMESVGNMLISAAQGIQIGTSDTSVENALTGQWWFTGGRYYYSNLPTTNPRVSGQLWLDGETLKISKG